MYNICTVYGKQLTITEGSIVSPGVVVTAGKVEETTLKSSMSDTPNREKYRQYKNHHYWNGYTNIHTNRAATGTSRGCSTCK